MFVLRNFGLLTFDAVKIRTYAIILTFCVVYVFGHLSALYFSRFKLPGFRPIVLSTNKARNLKWLAFACISLSLLSLSLFFIKFLNLSAHYGVEVSYQGVSDLRASTMNDSTVELGSSIAGVISTSLFGFPLFCGVIAWFYSSHLSARWLVALNATFYTGLFFSFLSGGRFTALVFLLFFVFGKKFIREEKKKVSNRKGGKLIYILVALTVLILSSKMFFDRRGVDADISDVVFFFRHCEPSNITILLINEFPSLGNLIGLLAYFDYYFAHGVNELDILLNAGMPANGPYWGGYEFSTFFLFFSKIGFNVMTIDSIVLEIVNPGVYFTQIGALYLDFSLVGIIITTFLFGISFGLILRSFAKNKSLITYFAILVFMVQLVTSPVVSIVGSGYFPAILVTLIFCFAYKFFLPLPKNAQQ